MNGVVCANSTLYTGPWPSHFKEWEQKAFSPVQTSYYTAWLPNGMWGEVENPNDSEKMRQARKVVYGKLAPKEEYGLSHGLQLSVEVAVIYQGFLTLNGFQNDPCTGRPVDPNLGMGEEFMKKLEQWRRMDTYVEKHWLRIVVVCCLFTAVMICTAR